MKNININNCWYGFFLDAYTYTTNYLLFSLATTIISVVALWIYEKPRFYKLIFKRSKHSNIVLNSVPSNENLLQRQDENIHNNCNTNMTAPLETKDILKPKLAD